MPQLHAAVPRESPDRHVSVSARLPREQRVPVEARDADAGDTAQGARVCDGRVCGRLSARRAVRAHARFRRVRRTLRRRLGRRVHHRRASGDDRGGRSHRLDSRPGRPMVHLGPCLRAARPVPAAAALRQGVRRSSVLRRSRRRRRRARPAVRSGPRLAASDARHPHGRSR